jgi:hypothetical protein
LPSENAHLAFRAIRPAMSAQRGRLRYAAVRRCLPGTLRSARDEILETAQEPRTARQLGVDTGEIGERLRAVIHTMTLGGVLLRVGAESLRSNAPNYVAADTWLGTPGGLPEVGPDEALSWLTGEYLRAFGPAWPEDFRWWAGVSKERAVAALGSVETVEMGDGYLLPSGDRGWGASFAGGAGRMRVDLDLFERPGARLKRTIEERFEEAAALLGAGRLPGLDSGIGAARGREILSCATIVLKPV